MNMETEELEIEELDTDEVETVEAEDSEAEEDVDGEEADDGDGEEGDEGDDSDDDGETLTVTIGDDEPEDDGKAPEWVRELRRENAEKNRRIKELEAQVNGVQNAQESKLRDKPTLAQHDYDDAAYEADLDKWYGEKREHDQKQAEAEEAQQAEAERWQQKLAKFEEGKAALKVKDLDEAEAVITDTFNQMQMGIVVEGSKDPALVFYALGKNPKRAAEMAKITNPIEFARAIFEVEGQLNVSKGKKPAPEKRVRGNSGAGATDNKLEKLREEAARTGDMSKVLAYKNRMKK